MKTTLYKRNTNNGKIQVWTIEQQMDAYRTISGYQGGAMTTSEWTYAKEKNVGKANATTGWQQATLEINAKVTKKKEDGYTEILENVDQAQAAAWLEPMLAHPIEKKPKAVRLGDVIVIQPKLDGIRCIGTKDGLFSRNGKPIVSCPNIAKEVAGILRHLPEGTRLDGELYNHDFKNDFNTLVSLIRKSEALSYEDQQKVQYHLYDLDTPSLNYTLRYAMLEKCEDHGLYPSVRIVPSEMEIVEEDWKNLVDKLQVQFVEQGYEGAMIRIGHLPYEHKRSDGLLKVKTFMDKEFEILDILEGEGNRSNMAGKLVVKVDTGKTSESGIAGGVTFYKWLWENREQLIGKKATVKFFGYTLDGKLRFPVTKTVDRQDL